MQVMLLSRLFSTHRLDCDIHFSPVHSCDDDTHTTNQSVAEMLVLVARLRETGKVLDYHSFTFCVVFGWYRECYHRAKHTGETVSQMHNLPNVGIVTLTHGQRPLERS